MDIIWSHNQESITISYSSMVSIKYIWQSQKIPLIHSQSCQAGPILAVYCVRCEQPPAHFQTIFKFRTFLPKFSNILPFFALFRNNHTHALTFQNRPCQSAQFTMLETFQGFPFSSVIITCTIFFYNLFYQRFYILCSTIVARGILADIKKII